LNHSFILWKAEFIFTRRSLQFELVTNKLVSQSAPPNEGTSSTFIECHSHAGSSLGRNFRGTE
jgi:hypothetical protein